MSESRSAAIADPAAPIVTDAGTDMDSDELSVGLRNAGFDVAEWTANSTRFAANDLMMTIINIWRLPDVYAANWNAIAEGLHMRASENAGAVALVVRRASRFAEADPIQWEAGLRTLTALGEEWRALGGLLRVVVYD